MMMMMHAPCEMTNQSCATNTPSQQYAETKAGCTTQYHQNCSMPEKLLWLADEAWEELIREKIRDHIEASCGTMMDEIAKMTAHTSCAKWEHKMKAKNLHHEFKHGLRDLFEHNKKKWL